LVGVNAYLSQSAAVSPRRRPIPALASQDPAAAAASNPGGEAQKRDLKVTKDLRQQQRCKEGTTAKGGS